MLAPEPRGALTGGMAGLAVSVFAVWALAAGPADAADGALVPGGGEPDLAERNHPELFRTRRDDAQPADSPMAATAAATPEPLPTAGIDRPFRGNPIPLNQLDSSLVQRVYFDYDKTVLRPEARKGIEINARWIERHGRYEILLEGHCDERGTNEYNLALGERRADAVAGYLETLGVRSGRISTRSWGEEKPLDTGRTEEAYQLNRRVEFYAIPLRSGID